MDRTRQNSAASRITRFIRRSQFLRRGIYNRKSRVISRAFSRWKRDQRYLSFRRGILDRDRFYIERYQVNRRDRPPIDRYRRSGVTRSRLYAPSSQHSNKRLKTSAFREVPQRRIFTPRNYHYRPFLRREMVIGRYRLRSRAAAYRTRARAYTLQRRRGGSTGYYYRPPSYSGYTKVRRIGINRYRPYSRGYQSTRRWPRYYSRP